jgi:hypothetical protein
VVGGVHAAGCAGDKGGRILGVYVKDCRWAQGCIKAAWFGKGVVDVTIPKPGGKLLLKSKEKQREYISD